ncbi:unnamed protein product [Protopolystoma xenopodis]|uniref:Uncharacterized protein n=1 Tax=Protopolystoma xenopodis TaxID=117903 RepID=A0A448WUB1_9PLAT|nr:unnamed protein product [Protopolystoma xenopodis]
MPTLLFSASSSVPTSTSLAVVLPFQFSLLSAGGQTHERTDGQTQTRSTFHITWTHSSMCVTGQITQTPESFASTNGLTSLHLGTNTIPFIPSFGRHHASTRTQTCHPYPPHPPIPSLASTSSCILTQLEAESCMFTSSVDRFFEQISFTCILSALVSLPPHLGEAHPCIQADRRTEAFDINTRTYWQTAVCLASHCKSDCCRPLIDSLNSMGDCGASRRPVCMPGANSTRPTSSMACPSTLSFTRSCRLICLAHVPFLQSSDLVTFALGIGEYQEPPKRQKQRAVDALLPHNRLLEAHHA